MPLYVKTTLWNEKNQTLSVHKNVLDDMSLQAGKRKRFNLGATATDAGEEVVGVFDSVIIRGDQVWVDYLLVDEKEVL